jgi:crotonobetainyl-CoA:carnitine CoA-transferase CaiB-like acyl-CoA transferase
MARRRDIAFSTALKAIGLELPAEAPTPVGVGPRLPSRLAVEEVGGACVGAALAAASLLHEARTGSALSVAVDLPSLQAALISERLFAVDGGDPVVGFAPQSRFWPARDGWVRTHANFPWHHEALLRALGAEDDSLAAAIAALPARELEERAFAAGGVAAAVRQADDWLAHPQGEAVSREPLIEHRRLGEGEPRRGTTDTAPSDGPPLPAAGIRVLDLTRVIAGPVCSRYLGALGADVLRLDPPRLPDLVPGEPGDTLLGKRSAFVDLGSAAGARRLEELLADADLVIDGYRPGSLARFGLAPVELARRQPGIVVVELAAWGHTGPWAGRRGFDSIVQAASGIAREEARDDEPGALPCQLLDHGTGYLAAAAALQALAEQRTDGGSHLRRLSLARTAHWLLQEPRVEAPAAEAGPVPQPLAAPAPSAPGEAEILAAPPPGSLGGIPLRWREPPARYGADAPGWGA